MQYYKFSTLKYPLLTKNCCLQFVSSITYNIICYETIAMASTLNDWCTCTKHNSANAVFKILSTVTRQDFTMCTCCGRYIFERKKRSRERWGF